MNSAIYLHALTPVHAGTGQVSASVIDLPIAREKATNWPVLPATSLKGVLRDAVKDTIPVAELNRLFGYVDPKDPEKSNAGELRIGDARLLCFPVRSWKGVFAYVTCPLALNRLKRDFNALGVPVPFEGAVPSVGEEDALVGTGSLITDAGKIRLDDLELSESDNSATGEIALGIGTAVFDNNDERAAFLARFVILSDTVFDFLAETATEITARIRLEKNTKTVEKHMLWYEEAVPAEAIFVAPALEESVPVQRGTVVQIGGNETVGRGFCRVMVKKQ